MRQDGDKNYPYIYTFSNKVISMYKLNYLILNNQKKDIPYQVRADGIYVDNELAFQITDGKISYVTTDPDAQLTDLGLAGDFELIKIPETDQLAGKTFEGRFYDNHDRQIHPYINYVFGAADKQYGVGITKRGEVSRTATYTSIGNIAGYYLHFTAAFQNLEFAEFILYPKQGEPALVTYLDARDAFSFQYGFLNAVD